MSYKADKFAGARKTDLKQEFLAEQRSEQKRQAAKRRSKQQKQDEKNDDILDEDRTYEIRDSRIPRCGRPKVKDIQLPHIYSQPVSIREDGKDKGSVEFEIIEKRARPKYFYTADQSRAIGTFVDARKTYEDEGTYLCLVTRHTDKKTDRMMIIGSDIHDIIRWIELDQKNADTRRIMIFNTYERPFRSEIFPQGDIPPESTVYNLEMITTQFERYTPRMYNLKTDR